MLDELLSLALIGTTRGGSASSPLPGALEESANRVADPSPEQRLLTRAALLNAYLRAGRKPMASGAPSGGAEIDLQPICSVRAADLLEDLIRDQQKELIVEWIAGAVGARRRAPHRLLPELLNFAGKNKSLRESIVAVIDQRGRWLMAQNAEWQFATADDSLDESLWETGTPDQRIILLRQVRKNDPARARELLQKTWKDDPADKRAEFLGLFVTGLSPADEQWLETLLDDRSKQVRTVSSDLLARLPQSQLVQRMTARLSALIQFKRGMIRGIKLEINLPADLDKSTQRDGIESSPPTGVGERQWWLRQMISFVPLSFWTQASDLVPTDVIAAVGKNEFAEVVLQGMSTAAERHLDPLWLDPLSRHGLQSAGRLNAVLLAGLPAQQYLGLALDLLREKKVSLAACADLINGGSVPLDLPISRLWVQTIAELARGGSREEQVMLYHLPSQCSMRLHPDVRPEIESLWLVLPEPFGAFRSNVEKLAKTLEIRQQIQKEFTS